MRILYKFLTKENLLIMQGLQEVYFIWQIKYKGCDYFLQYEGIKCNSIKYECATCNNDYSNKTDEESKKRFNNAFKFTNNDINKEEYATLLVYMQNLIKNI